MVCVVYTIYNVCTVMKLLYQMLTRVKHAQNQGCNQGSEIGPTFPRDDWQMIMMFANAVLAGL